MKIGAEAETIPPWSHYAALHNPARRTIEISDLIALGNWRREERVRRCNGQDPLRCLLAYGQNKLVYENGRIIPCPSQEEYEAIHRDEKVNRFGPVYRGNAPFVCHRKLADVMVEAAIDLFNAHGWRMVVFDAMRTVEANWVMYRDMHPDDRAAGLLAKPGNSAHNRAMAADSMFFDDTGREITMCGHFDHSDMESNHRNYDGAQITPEQTQNRRLRECGFQRAALRCGTLIAPLREEFWDERMPGSPADFWRVLESVARCMRLTPSALIEQLQLQCKGLSSPEQAPQAYGYFVECWHELLKGQEKAFDRILGGDVATPPPLENFTFHEWHNVLYDRDLKTHNLHLAREEIS